MQKDYNGYNYDTLEKLIFSQKSSESKKKELALTLFYGLE